jgi:hypothetical protein
MALAERAQALASTGFATMVRDEPAKQAKRAHSDNVRDDRNTEDKAAGKLRSADLLPPVSWANC